MSGQSNTILVILGMHRSGTSLTSRWLNQCGVKMHEFIGPDIGNEDGHFEDSRIVNLQSRIIKSHLKESKGWIIQSPFFKSIPIKGYEKEFKDYLSNRGRQSSPIWGWKDPRTCLLINHWIRIEKDLKVLVVYRPSINILHSLLKRSRRSINDILKINLFQAMLTTFFYQKEIVEFCRENPEKTLAITIDRIQNFNKQSFQEINNFLDNQLHYFDINEFLKSDRLSTSPKSVPLFIKLLYYCSPLRKIDLQFREIATMKWKN